MYRVLLVFLLTILTYGYSFAQNAPTVTNVTFDIDEYTISATGSESGTVVATDLDDDILSYEFTSGNDLEAFSIDEFGEITVDDDLSLDFETNPIFTLIVEVTDDETIPQAGTETITINLNDISSNDFCTNAITVGVGVSVSGSTFDATNDGAIASNCGGNFTDLSSGSVGVWYHIVGNGETITLYCSR